MEDTQQQSEKVICGRRVKTCRKCQRRYPKEEKELWTCPACGEDRKCLDSPMENGSCQRHGGKSLGGIASPRAKTLDHSRYVPKRLSKAFKRAEGDTNYLTLRFDRDFIIARMDELARQMDESAPGAALWNEAHSAFGQFTQAQAEGSVPGMQKALGKLAERLAEGKRDGDLKKEYSFLQKQLQSLLIAETKLLKDTGKMVPVFQVQNLMRRIQEILFAEIKDREILRRIAAEFRALEGD